MITNLSIDPTYACNERCVSCRCEKIAPFFTKKLKIEDYYRVIDEFVSLNGTSVSMYGGEPLIIKETFEILKYAKVKNLKTSITTNGSLLSDIEICQKLVDTMVDKIIISIMSDKDGYEDAHGRNYFEKVANAIVILRKLGFEVENRLFFHTTLQEINYDKLPNIISFASEIGVRNVSCQYVSIIKKEDNDRTEIELQVSFDNRINHWDISREVLVSDKHSKLCVESVKVAREIAKKNAIILDIDPIFKQKNIIDILETGEYDASGNCVLDSVVLMPDGRVGACPMLQHYVVGDVNRQKLADIIDSFEYNKIKNRVERGKLLPVCKSCCRHSMFYEGGNEDE